MALHKIVNGVKIDLTPEEEAATVAEWEANRLKVERKRLELEAEQARKDEIKAKLAAATGLSMEELKAVLR